jgi:hypothetical protein
MQRPVIVLVIGDVGPDLAKVVAAAVARYTDAEVPIIQVDDAVGKMTYADLRRFCLGRIDDRRKAYAQAERAWLQLLTILPWPAIMCLECRQYCGTCRCDDRGYELRDGWHYVWNCKNWVVVLEVVRALPPDAFDSLHGTTAGNLRAFVASLRG